MSNALARESSPYLRQHADNPVDWLPWGERAFALAREKDRPIFLSIGYSTCHWCHVMARESFENAAIAERLNADFVPVKLDREERPDVDRVYMAYVQALTGQGGWPMSVWLTPDLKPFYAGTYFPPEDRGGRAGFPSVLRAIARGWSEDREHLKGEAERVIKTLRDRAREETSPGAAPQEPLAEAASNAFEKGLQYYEEVFDAEHGGFGGAPKFPRPANLVFLLRCAALQGVESAAGRAAAGLVGRTLRAMASGGIHDHVGGGFHRYAVDAAWFVPHFEKMLYDQAQIALVALEAWQATGDERHAWLARDILDYVLRDLTAEEGGLCSAEDADSDRPEGGGHAEGAFYVWTYEELERILGTDAPFVASHFGVQAAGNVPVQQDPHREFAGKNILAQQRPLAETARAFGHSPEEASERLVSALDRLRSARAARPRPLLDDKVITAWNALTISAFARASSLPAESIADRRSAFRLAAVRAVEFIQSRLWIEESGTLLRSRSRGIISGEGFAEDYAFLIQALLDLYEATFSVRWLEWAERLQRELDGRFWDGERGGYFNSAANAADVVLRLKEAYDGAEPAPTSVATLNLLRLSGLTGDERLRTRARQSLAAFRHQWESSPQAMPQLLCALEPALGPPRHVVLTGRPSSEDFSALAAVLSERAGPMRTVIALDADGARAWFSARHPWLEAMGPDGGQAVAYVCEEFVCRAPARSPEALRSALGSASLTPPPRP